MTTNNRELQGKSSRLMVEDGWFSEWSSSRDHLYRTTMGDRFELNSMDTEYLNLDCVVVALSGE